MEKAINYNWLYNTVEELYENSCGAEHVAYRNMLDLISNAPDTNTIEIIRCKDCLNRDHKSHICMEFRQRYPFYPDDDFYCGFGRYDND